MKHVVVAGATGLVGKNLVAELAARGDCTVVALCRTAGSFSDVQNVQEVVFDFNDEASYLRLGQEIPCDLFFCCLGTTLRKAGSKEAFTKVDLDYPLMFIKRLAKLHNWPRIAVVSSVGAERPVGFYLTTKFNLENAIRTSGLPYLIVRPSLLLGERGEFRLGEQLAQWIGFPILWLARATGLVKVQAISRILPIHAGQVARALVRLTLETPSSGVAAEGNLLR